MLEALRWKKDHAYDYSNSGNSPGFTNENHGIPQGSHRMPQGPNCSSLSKPAVQQNLFLKIHYLHLFARREVAHFPIKNNNNKKVVKV